MGIYLFKKEVLQQWLEEDAHHATSQHDFGRDILPKMVKRANIFAYNFEGYWRDIGTIQTYWQANMDILEMSPGGYLSDTNWPIHTNEVEKPSAVISETANVGNSLLSDGCVIEGDVEHSVLSPGVIVSEGAKIKDSVIMSNTTIGSHSVVDHSIVDKEVIVEAGCNVGCTDDCRPNRRQPDVLNNGITIVGKKAKLPPGTTIGRNCIICPSVAEDDFPTAEVRSGETIRLRRRDRAGEA